MVMFSLIGVRIRNNRLYFTFLFHFSFNYFTFFYFLNFGVRVRSDQVTSVTSDGVVTTWIIELEKKK